MADIELVIKIEEETYNRIMNGWMPLHKAVNLMENIQKGTPLPEHHGRLIDADKLIRDTIKNPVHAPYIHIIDMKKAPTIIEAEGSESE